MACCCGQAACSLFSCCPSCSNSTSTKVMYSLMLLVAVILSCITLTPGLQSFLQKVNLIIKFSKYKIIVTFVNRCVQVPFCKNDQSSGLTKDFINNLSPISVDCKDAVGYLAVYRICYAMFVFFSLMALIMMRVKDSRDRRAHIQNG